MRLPAQDQVAEYARLTEVTRSTSLLYVDQPWHLKLHLTLFDQKGGTSQEGTIERWQSGDDARTVYSFGPSTEIFLSSKGKSFHEVQGPPAPDVARASLDAILHPGPYPSDFAGTLAEKRIVPFGKVSLECVMLARKMPQPDPVPTGLFPTYCLTSDGRLNVSYNLGSHTMIVEATGRFLQHLVTMRVILLDGGRLLVRGDVMELKNFTPSSTDFEPSSELLAAEAMQVLSATVVAGRRLNGEPPVYPQDARQKRITGTVILRAVIGSDGKIRNMVPISAPSPSLAISALTAVQQWTYKPYLLNGVPTEVQTQITVNYSLR